MRELEIAKVIADLKASGFVPSIADAETVKMAHDAFMLSDVIVDATDIYESLKRNERPIDIYGDFSCLAPPWEDATIAYRNEHGNVVIMNMHVIPANVFNVNRDKWNSPNEIDWDKVHWCLYFNIWVGGAGNKGKTYLPTIGPLCSWQWLIDKDGKPLDYHWIQYLEKYDEKIWDMALLVTLQSLSLLNCKNVQLEEPIRRKHNARRLEQYGTKISVITINPLRKSRKGIGGSPVESSVPLHSVRGHFAHYGPKYGTGLLFGKIEGRFFIPQHARGSKEAGQTMQQFKLKAE